MLLHPLLEANTQLVMFVFQKTPRSPPSLLMTCFHLIVRGIEGPSVGTTSDVVMGTKDKSTHISDLLEVTMGQKKTRKWFRENT